MNPFFLCFCFLDKYAWIIFLSYDHMVSFLFLQVPDIIDNAYVIVEFENGSRGMLDLCMFAEGSKNEQEISVVGDIGKVKTDLRLHPCVPLSSTSRSYINLRENATGWGICPGKHCPLGHSCGGKRWRKDTKSGGWSYKVSSPQLLYYKRVPSLIASSDEWHLLNFPFFNYKKNGRIANLPFFELIVFLHVSFIRVCNREWNTVL